MKETKTPPHSFKGKEEEKEMNLEQTHGLFPTLPSFQGKERSFFWISLLLS